tara:strand:- start:4387 stop:5016 length:630 start_codon:yes stop_codon:yes gene_type:complete
MPKKLGPNPDLSQLVADIEEDFLKGKSKVASEIFYRLQYLGPWWTGGFSKSWKVDTTPIQPDKVIKVRFGRKKGRTSQGGDFWRGDNVNGPIPDPRFPRKPTRPRVIRTELSQLLYIGNEANYAGFATNLGQTVPVMKSNRRLTKKQRKANKGAESRTYEDHAKYYKITARDPSGAPNPDWFKVYVSQSKLLEEDIAKGLSKASRRFKL